jgi:hypothetical protein
MQLLQEVNLVLRATLVGLVSLTKIFQELVMVPLFETRDVHG